MAQVQKNEVPEYKKELVKGLSKTFDENNTLMFASIKGLPAAQFQKIKKGLEGEAEVKVVKKRLLKKAIEGSKKEGIKKLEDYVKEDMAVLISNLNSFDLAMKLGESQTPVKAKAGQIADSDVEIEAGPTELPAGPAVSELGRLGLQVQVKEGKIEIAKPKIIVKKGEEISDAAASVMGKLDIMPFFVGFIPSVSYDSESDLVFTELEINVEKTIGDMREMFAKARAFAASIGFYTKETIGILLGKAVSHEKAIENLVGSDSGKEKEEVKDANFEENSGDENVQEKSKSEETS